MATRPSRTSAGWRGLVAEGLAASVDRWSEAVGRPLTPEDVEPDTWERAQAGRGFSAVQVHQAMARLLNGAARLPEWWTDGRDVPLTPTNSGPAPLIGEFAYGTPSRAERTAAAFGLFTMPAISLPVHRSADGLPIGVQAVADVGREDTLLRLAAQLEHALPWRDRCPGNFGEGRRERLA